MGPGAKDHEAEGHEVEGLGAEGHEIEGPGADGPGRYPLYAGGGDRVKKSSNTRSLLAEAGGVEGAGPGWAKGMAA